MANPIYQDNFTSPDGTALTSRQMTGTAATWLSTRSGDGLSPLIYGNRITYENGAPGQGGSAVTPADSNLNRYRVSVRIYPAPSGNTPTAISLDCDATGAGGYQIGYAALDTGTCQLTLNVQRPGSGTDFDWASTTPLAWPSQPATLDIEVNWLAARTLITGNLTADDGSSVAISRLDTAAQASRPTPGKRISLNEVASNAGYDSFAMYDATGDLFGGILQSAAQNQGGPITVGESEPASGGEGPYTTGWYCGLATEGLTDQSSPTACSHVIQGLTATTLSWGGPTGPIPNRVYFLARRTMDAAGAIAWSLLTPVKSRPVPFRANLVFLYNSLGGYPFAEENYPPNREEHRVPAETGDDSMPGLMWQALAPKGIQMSRHTYPGYTSNAIIDQSAAWQQDVQDTSLPTIVISEPVRNDIGAVILGLQQSNTTVTAANLASALLQRCRTFVDNVRSRANGNPILMIVEGLYDLSGIPVGLNGEIAPNGTWQAYNALLQGSVGDWLDGTFAPFQNPGDNTNPAWFTAPDPTHPNAGGNAVRRDLLIPIVSTLLATAGNPVPAQPTPAASVPVATVAGGNLILSPAAGEGANDQTGHDDEVLYYRTDGQAPAYDPIGQPLGATIRVTAPIAVPADVNIKAIAVRRTPYALLPSAVWQASVVTSVTIDDGYDTTPLPGDQIQFAGRAVGVNLTAPNATAVTWSATAGTISSAGLHMAPARALSDTVYHIHATSVLSPAIGADSSNLTVGAIPRLTYEFEAIGPSSVERPSTELEYVRVTARDLAGTPVDIRDYGMNLQTRFFRDSYDTDVAWHPLLWLDDQTVSAGSPSLLAAIQVGGDLSESATAVLLHPGNWLREVATTQEPLIVRPLPLLEISLSPS